MPIASTAIVHPGARIDPSTTIGDFCIVEDNVEIGPGNRIDPFVVVKRYTKLGEGNHIYAGAQLGTDPLDRKFREEVRSYLRIGNQNILREYMTISRGTPAESATEMGDGNFVMTNVHIAHNCKIGNGTTICSNVLLGGFVTVEDQAFLSGGVLVHQFGNVGRLCMVSGSTRVNLDAPPFFTVAGFEIAAHGLNKVGLRRAGFSADTVVALKRAYRLLYRSGLSRDEALVEMAQIATPEVAQLVAFIRLSKRGICRAARSVAAAGDAAAVNKSGARPVDASSSGGESTATDPDIA